MSRLTQFALRQKSVVLLIAVGLFLSGLIAWGQLRQELLPDIELPIVTVISALPGAGAEDVATQVTEPIERALANVPRLEQTQSTSASSLSLVVAQFSFGTDLKETLSTIQTQLDSATLPAGVDPRVTSLNLNDQPVIVATIAPAEGADPIEAARIARDIVAPEIRSLDGVSSADLSGGATAVMSIRIDPAKLAETGISVAQIQGVIGANQITLPSGSLTEEGLRLPISTEHRFTSAEELENLIVGVKGAPAAGTGLGGGLFGGSSQPGSGTQETQGTGDTTGEGSVPGGLTIPEFVLLGDVATIGVVDVQQSGYARTNGEPSLTLTVSKASGANTVQVADAVNAAFVEIMSDHPEVTITTIQDLSIFIKESRDGLVKEGLLGALFAIITIWIFLLSIRTTLVAAVSIPLSILIALLAMGVAGLTVNVITLGGLAVAVGRVVDDSIVVLENIFRHRAKGERIGDAVYNGTREVAAAITSSTITTVAVFLPIGFVGGIVSQFFLPFGLTVTFALLASLLVALTVIPVLAFFFMRKVNVRLDADGELPETIWQRFYTPALVLALRNRVTKWGTLAITFALFVATLSLVPMIPTSFIDSGGEKILNVSVAPPTGASTEVVIARVGEVESIVGTDPAVELVQSTIPGDADTGAQTLRAAFSGRAANTAQLTVRLKDDADLDATRESLTAALEAVSTDGFDIQVAEESGFGGGGFSVIVSSEDRKAVAAASAALVPALDGIDGLDNVQSDLVAAAPQVQVAVDPNKAIGAGLTTAQVAGEIRTVLVGQTLGTASTAEGDTLSVFLSVDSSGVDSVDALKKLPVGTARKVPLGTIADVSQIEAQGTVTRVDGAPATTISATVTGDNQGQITRETQAVIDALTESGDIPPGVDVTIAGVAQQQSEAFSSLFFAMGFAILVVYIVMVLVFGSLIDPLVILFSLPLATIGAFPALLLTGRPLGISALIGFLMLIGIVVTNAIVLLDLVEQLRHRGLSTQDALIQGGRTRVRPILMTAVATILALLPVAAGLSEGSIIAAELGTVVIGGLFSSTFLTLIVIPVIYSLVDGGKSGVARRMRRFGEDEPVAAVTEASAAPTASLPSPPRASAAPVLGGGRLVSPASPRPASGGLPPAVGCSTAMPRTLVVVNPNASRLKDAGTRQALIATLERVLRQRDGEAPAIVVPSGAEEAIEVARAALADGATLVIGAGGDGTLKDLAQVVAGTDVPLGMVPGGTGNVLAGVLGVPGSLDAAAGLLATAVPRRVDLGDVTVELDTGPGSPPDVRQLSFMVGAGIGFDARVMQATPAELKRRLGRSAYFVQAAWVAARIGAVPYRITVDGETIELDGSIALVTNFAELVPGLIRTRLPVVPDDGLFDVFVAGARNPIAGVRGLLDHLVRTGLGHDEAAGTIRLRGRRVRLEAMPHEPLQVDGDALGAGALEAVVRPGALRVLVPPGPWPAPGEEPGSDAAPDDRTASSGTPG